MSAYPTPLTPNSVQAAMQLLTINSLGLPNPSSPTDPVYSAVRIGWQQLGQPAQFINQDVAYLRCVTVDAPEVNRQRDSQILPNPADTNDPPQSVIQLFTYMRVWQTFWEFYGPNDFDRARKVHSAFFTQVVHDTFATLGLSLYWVPDSACPQRVPYYSDGQWWERVDFEARFNELVSEVIVIPLAASVEIQEYTKYGKLSDFTVPLQGD